MTVFILLIVAAALGLAFAAYKYPAAYRVMFIFVVPVLVMGGFVVLMVKIGDLNASVKSIYSELHHIQKDCHLRSIGLPNKKLERRSPIS